MAQEVRWRSDGHQLSPSSTVDILRFEVVDLNNVIKSCVAVSELYDGLVEKGGLQTGSRVVPVSCFALTAAWTPRRLAAGTHFRSFRLVEAATLLDAGFAIWPTGAFVEGVPDDRNEVHYDVIVVQGELDLSGFASASKVERARARDALRPEFERLLALLGKAQPL